MQAFKLERHAYAPEMNKVIFVSGGTISAPGITSIKEAKDKLFKPVNPGKVACVQVSHSNPLHRSCDKFYQGRIHSLQHLKRFIDQLRTKHNLPDASIDVKSIKLVG